VEKNSEGEERGSGKVFMVRSIRPEKIASLREGSRKPLTKDEQVWHWILNRKDGVAGARPGFSKGKEGDFRVVGVKKKGR